MSTELTADPLTDALRGPWVAVLADRSGWLIDPDDLDEAYADGATVQIVRRTAAPGAREDGETDRLPGTYLSADHLVTFDDFDEPGDIWARWVQVQAMVAGLNAAAAVPAGGARGGWTSHGHWHGPGEPDPATKPAMTARCGGPGLCSQCSGEAAGGTQ